MSKTPIPEQQGLSKDDLDKMKPVEQKYTESGDTTLIMNGGVESQKAKISNSIHKIFSEHYERLKTMDSKDEYANEKELKIVAGDLANFTCSLVSAQKVTIETKVTTTDVLNGTATNVQTGVTTPMIVNGSGNGKGNSVEVIIR